MKSTTYSLEERLVEPFRSIRWLEKSRLTVAMSTLGLIAYGYLWWVFKQDVFNFWVECLRYLMRFSDQPWVISTGYWPEFASPYFSLPKISAGILPPSTYTWWIFALVTFTTWIYTDSWETRFLPLKAVFRFVLFLIMIALVCFGVSPMQFQHSVEEWSKIYFLGAYGSMLVYGIIWTLAVLWLPISMPIKILSTLFLLAYEILGTPLLIFLSTIALHYSSLLLLPLIALGVVPILQLGWFVSFYSIALSSGPEVKQGANLE